jgi:hypothetical protein
VLEAVGRPCRDRTYDQRIKSLSYLDRLGEQAEELQGKICWRREPPVRTEPIPNPNHPQRQARWRFSIQNKWLRQSAPNFLRTGRQVGVLWATVATLRCKTTVSPSYTLSSAASTTGAPPNSGALLMQIYYPLDRSPPLNNFDPTE